MALLEVDLYKLGVGYVIILNCICFALCHVCLASPCIRHTQVLLGFLCGSHHHAERDFMVPSTQAFVIRSTVPCNLMIEGGNTYDWCLTTIPSSGRLPVDTLVGIRSFQGQGYGTTLVRQPEWHNHPW